MMLDLGVQNMNQCVQYANMARGCDLQRQVEIRMWQAADALALRAKSGNVASAGNPDAQQAADAVPSQVILVRKRVKLGVMVRFHC